MWKYLLHFYPLDSTLEQREQLRKLKEYVASAVLERVVHRSLTPTLSCRTEYMVYRTQWQSVTPEQEANFTKLRSRKHKIGALRLRANRSCVAHSLAASPSRQGRRAH